MQTTTITEQAVEAIHRISVRDAQIAPLAKMNREDWLIIGEALSNLRKQYKSDKLYGQAVRDAGLDQGCCADRFTRADALWMYENATVVCTTVAHTGISHPNAIRRYIRGIDSEDRTTEDPVTLREARDSKLEIKVATTEFPPIVVEQPTPPPPPPPKVESEKEKLDRLNVAECFRPGYQQKSTLFRPPCPGVEGTKDGQYEWDAHDNQWYKIIDAAYKKPSTVQEPQVRGLTQFLNWYIGYTSQENRIKLAEAIRRLEHPDRGGSEAITIELNLILSKEKS